MKSVALTFGGIAHVTKKEIVKQISERANLTQLQTKEIVQWTFDAIIETLVAEGRIELRNFGVFAVKTRKPRRARNPRTNEEVQVEAKNVVTFQPGKIMEERVRKALVSGTTQKKSRKPDTDDSPEEPEILVGAKPSRNGKSHHHDNETINSELPLKSR